MSTFSFEKLQSKNFVLAELTTSEGPYVEDHFLLIMTKEGYVYEFSSESKFVEEILEFMRSRLNQTIQFQLCNSTDFSSVILYPEELEGRDFYVPKENENRKKNRVFRKFWEMKSEWVPAPWVVSYLH